MTKTPGHRLAPSSAPNSPATAPVERVGIKRFATRLYELRSEAGLSMSDLARKIWGTTTDTRGYPIAKNKDRISRWEKGDQIPEPQNLALLANALGVTVEDLAPDLTAKAVDNQPPAISMAMVAGHPDKCHLIVNTLCSLEVASKIISLLSGDAVAQAASVAG